METYMSGTDQPWCEAVCEGEHYMCERDAGHDGPHRVYYQDKANYIWTDEDPKARPETMTHDGGEGG